MTESAVCASDARFVLSRSTGKERDAESGNDYFGARYYASTMGRFMSPDWSAKEEPVPYSKLDNPQTLNLYSYTLNNPLSNVDTDGHACSGILGNSSSGFCTRATEYGTFDANPAVQSQTRFFAAANAVSQALADVDAHGSSLIGGISGSTASFLEGVGQNLEKLNQTEVGAIQNGTLSGRNLDQQLVHNEQSAVQGQLDSLQQSNPDAYKTTISEINGALNPGAVGQFASTRFSTDKAYAGVLDGVRKDLGATSTSRSRAIARPSETHSSNTSDRRAVVTSTERSKPDANPKETGGVARRDFVRGLATWVGSYSLVWSGPARVHQELVGVLYGTRSVLVHHRLPLHYGYRSMCMERISVVVVLCGCLGSIPYPL
jgi:RHS repeat-associated protein